MYEKVTGKMIDQIKRLSPKIKKKERKRATVIEIKIPLQGTDDNGRFDERVASMAIINVNMII